MSNSPVPSPDNLVILRAIAADPENFRSPDREIQLRVRDLCREKYIYKNWNMPGYVVLPQGLDAIAADDASLAAQEAAQRAADEQAHANAAHEEAKSLEKAQDVSRSWKQFWLGLLLGWLLGWVTPGDVYSFLVSLFK